MTYNLFKFVSVILDIIMEGKVSQIFYLGPSYYFIVFRERFFKILQNISVFLHKIKTKT